jgi:UrcA family protein
VFARLFEYHLNGKQLTLPDRTHASTEYEGAHAMKTFTLITTALALSGSILSIAHAAPPSDVPTATVNFGDLDTTRPAGEEELYRRVSRAAKVVCRSLDPSVSAAKLLAAPAYQACIDQAVAGAVVKINRPDFSNYVASRMPKPASTGIQLSAR